MTTRRLASRPPRTPLPRAAPLLREGEGAEGTRRLPRRPPDARARLRRGLERRGVRGAEGDREGAGREGLARPGEDAVGVRGAVPGLRGGRLLALLRARLRVPGRGGPGGEGLPGHGLRDDLRLEDLEEPGADRLRAGAGDLPLRPRGGADVEDGEGRDGRRRRAAVDQVDVPRVRGGAEGREPGREGDGRLHGLVRGRGRREGGGSRPHRPGERLPLPQRQRRGPRGLQRRDGARASTRSARTRTRTRSPRASSPRRSSTCRAPSSRPPGR